MSENNNDLGAFLAGFVIGGLVGAATALILAPQSGEEIRSQISSKSSDLRSSGGERLHQYRQVATDYTQEYREKAEQALASTRTQLQETGGRVQEQARIVLDAGKHRVAQVKEQVAGHEEEPVDETAAADSAAS